MLYHMTNIIINDISIKESKTGKQMHIPIPGTNFELGNTAGQA